MAYAIETQCCNCQTIAARVDENGWCEQCVLNLGHEAGLLFNVEELVLQNPMTVRNWISRGELPAVRVGSRRVRVRRADFDAFVTRSQAPGPTGTPRNTSGKRSSVVVFRGIEAPVLQRKKGPFSSCKLALEWVEREGTHVDAERHGGLGGGLPGLG